MLKTYNCIVFTDVSTQKSYVHLFQNLSLGLILKIFLKFRKFQPRYSYKIYSYKKKECMSIRNREPLSMFKKDLRLYCFAIDSIDLMLLLFNFSQH